MNAFQTRRSTGLLSRAAALGVCLVVLAGCSSLEVYWAVVKFSFNINQSLLTAYSPQAALTAKLPAELKESIARRNHDHQLLQAAYGPTNYAYRFVKNHLPTNDHDRLMVRLDEIWNEGIDTKPYELDRMKKLAESLTACQQALAALQQENIDISAEEKSELRTALLEANVSELSPAAIIAFAANPNNRNRFPVLYGRIAQLAQLAAQRDSAESQLELLGAANFFRLAQEMGVPEEKLIDAWRESRSDMTGALKKMMPTMRHYGELVQELARYRKLAKENQVLLDRGKSAKVGNQGEFVRQIQMHLQLTGYWSGPLDGKFTPQLKEAVVAYQTNHQLSASGTVGGETIANFNAPFGSRVKRIKVGLHRLRASGTQGINFFVWVNVAAQQLEVFDQGGSTVSRKHRIIVGQRVLKNRTPFFNDEIEIINFYPQWNVPQRIIREEMLPAYQADPEYFNSRGYRVRIVGEGENARVLSVTQPAGQGNALGIVKILFPNPFDVYLHDTPKKFLFAQSVRTFSHGCMRLQNAVDLARFLLEHDHNEYAAKVDEILKKHQSVEIKLTNKVPIFVEYTTTSAGELGLASFYLDIYNVETAELAQMSAD